MKLLFKTKFRIAILAMLLSGMSNLTQASCGGAFCMLNTDLGVQGVWSKPGMRLDVRAEYIDLNNLKQGSSNASAIGEAGTHDEIQTINRNLIATLDWNVNQKFGVTLRIPFVNRTHSHIFNADDGSGGVDAQLEQWHFTDIGDVQTMARYNFYSQNDRNIGVQMGLKLPTGSISKSNGEEAAERTLQPGTGSLDALVGAYYNHHHGALSWFVQGALQQTIHDRDNFRPGQKIGVDAGLSYAVTPDLSLLLQTNFLHKARDSGANAEPDDSGGDTVNISPGFSYRIAHKIQVYGFVQKPIYQYVNGRQLTPNWSMALGLSTQF